MGFMINISSFTKGAVLGLILPTLAFLVYSNIVMEGDMLALYYQLKAMDVHTHVAEFMYIHKPYPFSHFQESNMKNPRGILMVTILSALFVMINKFLF